jgi:hypothetical protein
MPEAPRISPSSASSIAACTPCQSTPECWQKRASSAISTASGRAGEIASIGAQIRSTRSPRAQRHSIGVETGCPMKYSGVNPYGSSKRPTTRIAKARSSVLMGLHAKN